MLSELQCDIEGWADDSGIIGSHHLILLLLCLLSYFLHIPLPLLRLSFLSPHQPNSFLLSSTQPSTCLPLVYSPKASRCLSPLLSLHTALGKQAQQRSRSIVCAFVCLRRVSGRKYLLDLHLCVCVLLLICIQCESARGERWSHDGRQQPAHFPSAPLVSSEEDRPCHVRRHLPLLSPLHLWLHYSSRCSFRLHIIHAHSNVTPVANNQCFFMWITMRVKWK